MSAVKKAAGYGLLVVGVAGIVLPIIPGIPFLLAAAAVLGSDHFLIRPWRSRLQKWRGKPETEESNP